MKKQLLKSALIAVAGVGLLAGSAMATLVQDNGTEDSLTEILAGQGWSIDTNADQITEDKYWQVSEGSSSGGWATMIIEIAGNALLNTFGIYDQSGHSQMLMDGAGTSYYKIAISWSKTTGKLSYSYVNADGDFLVVASGIAMDQTFGFYIGTPYGMLYSDSDKNGNQDQMVTYAGTGSNGLSTNHYVIAFEDSPYNTSDKDFNDMVLLVESVNPVPEPATMLLFGTGIVSLAGFARRRNSK